jgi:5-methylcytosine-specific restriction endonuclease McrA
MERTLPGESETQQRYPDEMAPEGRPDVPESTGRQSETRKAGIKVNHLKQLLEDQDYQCAYTGDVLTPETISADHKVPVCRGGGYEIENIALVTKDVNRAKGTMRLEDFISLCRKVAKRFPDEGTEKTSEASGL